MTNQQWSPAALAHELFTAAQLAPGEGIENAVGRLAALVEAQQPAPSAAADLIAALEEARSAINSMKVEAETAGQGDEQMMLEACETISNEGLQADMAIRAALASAPKPSSTPQADSQPAPVRDYPPLPDFETVEQHIYGACRRYITQDMLEPIHNLIRDVIDADRAARAPADSVTAPASGATGKNLLQVQAWVIPDGNGGGQFSWQKQDERYWTRLTPPAQAADGVLEDAARYRFLAGHCRSTSEHWGGRWSIIVDGPAPKSHDSEDDFDEAVDAARKQGANHD